MNFYVGRIPLEDGAVSIPFRADTGFELSCKSATPALSLVFQSLSGLTLGLNRNGAVRKKGAGKKFQSLSGLTLGLNPGRQFTESRPDKGVSIPFRADTGFEHTIKMVDADGNVKFQSLSGLTLGLNSPKNGGLL